MGTSSVGATRKRRTRLPASAVIIAGFFVFITADGNLAATSATTGQKTLAGLGSESNQRTHTSDKDDSTLICYIDPADTEVEKLLQKLEAAPPCTHYVLALFPDVKKDALLSFNNYLIPRVEDDSRAGRRFGEKSGEKELDQNSENKSDSEKPKVPGKEKELIRLLRRKIPSAKIILGVGGGPHHPQSADIVDFFPLTETEEDRQRFAKTFNRIVLYYELDGLDLSLAIPKEYDAPQLRYDHQELVGEFLRTVRQELDKTFTLSFLVSAPNAIYQQTDAMYDVRALRDAADWITVAAYDLDDSKSLSHHAPLRLPNTDPSRTNGDLVSAVNSWLSAGFDPKEIVVAISLSGRRQHGYGVVAGNADKAAPDSLKETVHSQKHIRSLRTRYSEICRDLQSGQLSPETLPDAIKFIGGPSANSSDSIITYDSPESLSQKMQFIKSSGLRGAALQLLNFDDYAGDCGWAWPMLTTAFKTLFPDGNSAGETHGVAYNRVRKSENSRIYGLMSRSSVESRTNLDTAEPISPVPFWGSGNGDEAERMRANSEEQSDYDFPVVANRRSEEGDDYKLVCYDWMSRNLVEELASGPPCTHYVVTDEVLSESDYEGNKASRRSASERIWKGEAYAPLKKAFPSAKILLGLGSTYSDFRDTMKRLYTWTGTKEKAQRFAAIMKSRMEERGFDGLDISLLLPQGTLRADHQRRFGQLLRSLKAELGSAYSLSALVSAPNAVYKHEAGLLYDVAALREAVDWITVAAYDLDDAEIFPAHHSPLSVAYENGSKSTGDVVSAVGSWLSAGFEPWKIVIASSLYGRNHAVKFDQNAANFAKSVIGEQPKNPSYLKLVFRMMEPELAYVEICSDLRRYKTLSEGVDSVARIIGGSYAHSADKWISYESPDSLSKKMEYVKLRGWGGGALLHISSDDHSGVHCGSRFPLLTAAYKALMEETPSLDVTPVKGAIECQVGRNGYFRDQGDCSVVTKCEAGVATVIRCPQRLSYYPSTGTCEPMGCQSAGFEGTSGQRVDSSQAEKVVFCFLANWARVRRAEGRFVPENLEQGLCTHVVYSYFKLDPFTDSPATMDVVTDMENEWLRRVNAMKKRLGFKVLLGIGGWADSARSDKYSALVSDPARSSKFARNTLDFVKRHELDGVHMEWQYPKCWHSKCESGPASDKSGFANLIKNLRDAFDSPGLQSSRGAQKHILSVSVAGMPDVIDDGYDLPKISSQVDFLVAHTMAYHGPWESELGHLSPLYAEDGSVDATVTHLRRNGAAMKKVVLTLPAFGYSFYVGQDSSSANKPGSEAMGPGRAAQYTQQPGFMSYLEICSNVASGEWRKVPGNSLEGPYAYGSGSWVSFDDEEAMAKKADYIMRNELAGAALWSIDLDDFKNICCRRSFPLLRSLNVALGLLPHSAMLSQGISDCTKPDEPVTPPPPSQTTTYSSGGNDGESTTTTTPSWNQEITQTTPSTPTPPKPPTWPPTVPTTVHHHVHQPVTVPAVPTAGPGPDGEVCEFSGQMKQDPSACEFFLRCENGFWVRRQCPPGLHYSVASGLCDYKYRAGCLKDASATTTTSTESPFTNRNPSTTTTTTTTRRPTTTTTTTTTTQRTTTPTTTTTTEQQYYDCQWDGQRQTDYEHCAAYKECKKGRWHKRWCPPGLEYVDQLKSCYPPGPTSTCYQNPSVPYPAHQPQQEVYYPQPQYPSGSLWIPGWPTTAFDPSHHVPAQGAPSCQAGMIVAMSDTCSGFYECSSVGQYIPKSCPPGLLFDSGSSRCDWSYRVSCFYAKTSNEVADVGVRSEGSSDTKCSPGSTKGSKGCDKYEQCMQGVWIIRECPPGLHFSKKENICTWPDLAQCKPGDGADGNKITGAEPDKGIFVDKTPPKKPPSFPQVDANIEGFPKVTATDSRAVSGEYKLVCYFTNWAWYRNSKGKFMPEDIDDRLCTHIIYGFAVLDPYTLLIKPHDPWADFDNKFYDRVTAYQKKGIKVSIAIGGWNDSEGNKYSRLVNSPEARAKFVTHIMEFIEKHGFDGLDLDWEYPKCWQVDCKKGPDSDKDGFSAWVKELRAAFKPKGLLLSAAVSPSKTVIDAGYDVPVLAENLDWIAVMTYDFHGHWDKQTGHVAPLFYHPDDEVEFFNSDYALKYWMKRGAPAQKLVMGMPLYGQSFTLGNTRDTGLNSKSSGKGEAGRYTRAAGFLAYYEICEQILRDDWTIIRDDELRMGPYAFKDNQWVSFDDVAIIAKKTEYVKQSNLGGAMVWALDLDDFRNVCGQGKYPLLNTIKSGLLGESASGDFQGKNPPPKPVEKETEPPQLTTGKLETTTTAKPTTTTTALKSTPTTTTVATTAAPKATMKPQPTATSSTEEPTKAPEEPEAAECTGLLSRADVVDDCKSYKECVHGRWISRPCGAGTFFSKKMQACTTLKDSDCAEEEGEFVQKHPPDGQNIKPTEEPKITMVGGVTSQPSTTTTYAPIVQPDANAMQPAGGIQGESPYVEVSGDFEPTKPDEAIVVCYFTNWAWYRQGIGKYRPEDIDPSLCTHIQYGFAVLDYSELIIRIHDSWADIDNKFYEKVVEFKKKGIKVLLALGGWNDSAGDKYSRLVNNPSARQKFIKHALQFLEAHNFDGLDLDWEYPKCWQVDCRKGPASDKAAFAEFVKEIKMAFEPKGLMLTAAVSPSKKVVDEGYDVPALAKYLDFISVMTYDYHGEWDKKTGHVAPMFYHPDDAHVDFNTNYTIHYWIAKGTPRKKLVLGMPLYGRSFTLADSSQNGLNAKTYGNGEAGPYTRAGGFLAYYEICDFVKNKNWRVNRDDATTVGPYAYGGSQWVSFDDIDTLKMKSQWALKMGLAGGMVWALDLDDFRDVCNCEPHPLLRAINRVMRPKAIKASDPMCPKLGGEGKRNSLFRAQQAQGLVTVNNPAICAEGSSFRSDIDGGSFYKCFGGTYYLLQCSPSQVWNEFLGACISERTYVPPWGLPPFHFGVEVPSPPRIAASASGLQIASQSVQIVKREEDLSKEPKVVCYLTNWARYRESNTYVAKALEELEGNLCTHVIHAFAILDPVSLTMKPRRMRHNDGFMDDMKALKKLGVKVLAGLGGWGDSSTDKYSRLISSEELRQHFVRDAIQLLDEYGFDGLDIDWEFPACWQNDCGNLRPEDKQLYAEFASLIKEAFEPRNLLLSMSLSPRTDVIDAGFDIPKLSKAVDWFNVLAFDYNGPDPKSGKMTHLAPLYPDSDQTEWNADYTIRSLIERGANKDQLVLGVPFQANVVKVVEQSSPNRSESSKPGGSDFVSFLSVTRGEPGSITEAPGILAYFEICRKVENGLWHLLMAEQSSTDPGPFAISDRKGLEWASFEGTRNIKRKANYVQQNRLGGMMLWGVDLDDFRGICRCGKMPLLKAATSELLGLPAGYTECDIGSS